MRSERWSRIGALIRYTVPEMLLRVLMGRAQREAQLGELPAQSRGAILLKPEQK